MQYIVSRGSFIINDSKSTEIEERTDGYMSCDCSRPVAGCFRMIWPVDWSVVNVLLLMYSLAYICGGGDGQFAACRKSRHCDIRSRVYNVGLSSAL